jgi:hypothetical protein
MTSRAASLPDLQPQGAGHGLLGPGVEDADALLLVLGISNPGMLVIDIAQEAFSELAHVHVVSKSIYRLALRRRPGE